MVYIKSFPEKKYKVIYADPAWSFETYADSGKGRSPEQHYECMTLEDIQSLPVQDIAEEDCVLFIWVTWPLLQEGLDTIKAWGFKYQTCGFSWAKKNKSNMGFKIGMGFWTRSNTEVCLLSTKGNPRRKEVEETMKVHERSTAQRQLIISPLRDHSRKPEETYLRIERLVDGPYIELFARTEREGWSSWGKESDKFGG